MALSIICCPNLDHPKIQIDNLSFSSSVSKDILSSFNFLSTMGYSFNSISTSSSSAITTNKSSFKIIYSLSGLRITFPFFTLIPIKVTSDNNSMACLNDFPISLFTAKK